MEIFTLVHIAISLAGIFSGLVVLVAMLTGKRSEQCTALFLATTVATSVTGFMFPYHGFTPAIGVGIISLVVLAVTVLARYGRKLAGAWGKTYVVSAVVALYLNVFVAVAQAFKQIPALKELAPTQTEPPFAIAQIAVLGLFLGLGAQAVRKFRTESYAEYRS